MSRINRRNFLRTSALAGPAAGAMAAATPFRRRKAPAVAKDVTRRLARYVVSARAEDLPAGVRKEAARTLLNWTGCAVGGSRHATLDIAIGALSPFSGPAQATILGRKRAYGRDACRADERHQLARVRFRRYAFAHLIHPAGPVASAILAFTELPAVSGADFVNALVLGAEVECRIGKAVYPAHYDVGWHITGTVGPFGAAAAAGKLLQLSEQQMVWALGLAATQPVGLREMFGTMTQELPSGPRGAHHRGAAGFRNFTSSSQGSRRRAVGQRAQHRATTRTITENLGGRYEISENSYKPFPCGVVDPSGDRRLH